MKVKNYSKILEEEHGEEITKDEFKDPNGYPEGYEFDYLTYLNYSDYINTIGHFLYSSDDFTKESENKNETN